jgi:hypothetical protein
MRKVHPVTRSVGRKDQGRALKVHQRRDAAAAMELLPPLFQLGFAYGEQILNQPPVEPPEEPPAEPFPVDVSFTLPGDLLIETTRPPLDDDAAETMKRVERAYTDLEERSFGRWRRYFPRCGRGSVILAPALARQLLPGFETRQEMHFNQREDGAPYTETVAITGKRARPGGDRTAAFLLRVDEAWPGGPGLLGAFGLDGTSTLAWCHRLGRDHAHLLAEPGFTMVDMVIGDIPDRPTDLRWASTWKIEIALRADA